MALRNPGCTNVLRILSRNRNAIILQSRAYSSSSSSERPLYPSVEALLHEHNIKASDIKPTGPGGRLLKGDVLAHLGQIPSSAPESLSQKFSKWSHLDLSNITPAPPKEPRKAEAPVAAIEEELEPEYELALPIDLKPILQLQQKLQDTIGHAPPLSELLARAIGLSNTNLPPQSRAPTADELFDQLVGSSTTPKVSGGNFLPLINGTSAPMPSYSQSVDLFDELVAPAGSLPKRRVAVPQPLPGAHAGSINDFSVTVPAADRKRALVFLQRMKSVLEVEPGRLVL